MTAHIDATVRAAALSPLVVLLLASCQGPPRTLLNACVEDWPDEREPFTPAPAIDEVTPEILWSQRITGTPPNDTLILAQDHVLLGASSRLYSVERATGAVSRVTSGGRESITTAAIDDQGQRYFAGFSMYSVTPDGEYRYIVPLSPDPLQPVRARGRMIQDPDGVLFFGTDDGYLYAVEPSDGSVRWKRQASKSGERRPIVVGGIGDALLAFSPDGTWRPQLWNRHTGEPMAWFTSEDGERHGAMIGATLGIVTQRFEDRGGSYPWMHISVLDRCSKERFSVPATRPQWPVLIGPGDHLYVVERDDIPGSDTFVSVYAPDGMRAAGPTRMPIPWAIGADGTIYAVSCDSEGVEGPSRLHAYSADLEERWMLPLGDACPMSGPVIDDSGRLFFAWYRDRGTEIVAVQTPSPGLARTSWATRRGDERATGWVQ